MPSKRKIQRDGTQESPYSKRSRRTKPNQTEIAEKILDTIKLHQRDDGSLLASGFLKIPSKRQNPEYHEVVQEPIDLTRITQRLRMDEYRDVESLTADIDLLVSNTKKFYEEDSTESKDATALWELYLDTKAMALASDAPDEPTEQIQSSEDVSGKLDDIYNSLLAEVDEDGQGLTDMFMVLPDVAVYPDYYEKIKEPIDLTMIGEKVQNRTYKSVADFEKDFKQLIKNARTYNETNSKIYCNAVALKNVLQDRLQMESDTKVDIKEPTVKTSARLKQRNSARVEMDSGLKRQDAVDLPETGVRSSRATILVQASITESNLKGKEALQAKFYNEIVNCRNPAGHSISDAFVRLPNKHHYPAYYEEIQNPISLKAIRRNILNTKHQTFEELADDFRLLFQNAMQYNKEGSQIYKNAQTLFHFMEERLPHYCKLEEEIQGSDDEDEEIEEGDDEEEEDGDEDGEEEEEEEDQESVGTPDSSKRSRKKRDSKSRGSAQKEKPQDIYRKRLRTLYDAVLDGTYEDSDGDDAGRSMIVLFMEKPSRKDYPDYYKLILEPIDMKTIDKKIRQDKYPTVASLLEDFNLMFTNARHYNEPGSQVYQDAERLEQILKKRMEELPPLPGLEGQTTSVKAEIFPQKSNPVMKTMEQIYRKVRDHHDVTDREICEIFNRLPSKQELPDYYQVIKKPMDNDRIFQKMQTGVYINLGEFMADVLLMFENACTYNEPGSLIYKDALILQKVAVDAYDEAAGCYHMLPDVQSHVQELLTNLFVSVINHQDEDGRCYSDSLSSAPLLKEEPQPAPQPPPTEGEAMDTTESVPVTNVPDVYVPDEKNINLDTIRRNLHAKRYRRLDVFQEHMFHVFEAARKANRTDCEVYEDAVELQKFFIRIRDELCKNGETLMSPALIYNVKRLQTELDAEKQEKLPGEALEDEAGKEEGKEMREKVERSAASDGMDIQGVTYQPGDFVYVEDTVEAGKTRPHHIVCIEKLYQDESGESMMYGTWFYRPQDTYHLQTRKFLLKEVFKSDYCNTVPVKCIKGKCFVMIGKDYFKQKPVGYLEDDVHVCDSRYSSRSKTFKRIKLLNLPPNNTKIVLREKPLVPVRVSSIYSENSKENVAKLSDMHGPLVTDDLPWPATIIGKECPNVKIETAAQDTGLPAQQTFYLQFNINNLCLKVGDSVYVQQSGTDQRLKIARIDSMWSDMNGQMWFQGSWFAQPCETEHEPTRMFYKNEVFMLGFSSLYGDEATASTPPPTPLAWVVGVCSVLSLRDLTQCRPTEVQEMHVHVCESKYLPGDKTIKKIKGGLKKPIISHKVVDDEYYYFKKSLEVQREVSPQLAAAVRQEHNERVAEMNREQEEENRRKAMESQGAQGMVIPPQYPQQINPMVQPGAQRPYSGQQYAYQQVQYQQPQQQYVPPHPVQPQQYQQYATPQTQVPVQQHYTQYQQPGTPYATHPQMPSHAVVQPSPAGTPIQTHPQMPPQYQGIQSHPYTPVQSGMPMVAQSPMQTGVRQTATPIDRVETPGSVGSPAPPPTTTKKKSRGGHSTGYILFASECHPRMRAEHPNMPFGEISKLVGEEWRNQADEKKREYEERARELTAKAEAEGRPMQGKKKKKQQMRKEMEEAAAAAQQQQQQQQQHPPPQPVMVQGQQMGAPGVMQQTQYSQGQYHPGQYPTPQPGYQQQAIPGTPQLITPQQYTVQTPQMVSTPTPAHPPQGQPNPAQGQVYATPVNTTTVDQVSHQPQSSTMRRGPLFVKPPPKVQRVLHSEAYLRYIEGLEKGQRTISNFEKTLKVEEKDVDLSPADAAKLPVHWLANGKGKHETVKSALWALRGLMLKDALALKNHFS